MGDFTEMKKEPELESSNKVDNTHEKMNLRYSIIAGAIGGFLTNLFIDIVAYWAGNLNHFDLIESLFLSPLILGVVVFILVRTLVGGVFGYWAYRILRHKKPFTVIFGAFIAGLIGGAIIFSCAIVLSVQ